MRQRENNVPRRGGGGGGPRASSLVPTVAASNRATAPLYAADHDLRGPTLPVDKRVITR